MPDVVDKVTRSRMMSGIRGKNTRPEILIRSLLHRNGFRFRLHVKTLPGKPDIVLPKHRAVVFVNGCFWHGHDCHLFKWPSTRPEFWKAKIERTEVTDREAIEALHAAGWRVLLIWECSLKGKSRLPIEEVETLTKAWLQGNEFLGNIDGKEINQSSKRID